MYASVYPVPIYQLRFNVEGAIGSPLNDDEIVWRAEAGPRIQSGFLNCGFQVGVITIKGDPEFIKGLVLGVSFGADMERYSRTVHF